MTQITSVFPVTIPDAIDPLPGQPVLQQPAALAPASGQPCPQTLVPSIDPVGFPPAARTGPLRSGNPRGNPDLAPRCRAKARTTGCPCRARAMPNGRCRMHGGRSTGPRTAEGLTNLARTHTTHGRYAQTGPDAEQRAAIRHARLGVRRARLNGAAFDLLPWLPPAFSARLWADTAIELQPPRYATRVHAALVAPTSGPNAQTHATGSPDPPAHNPPGHNPPDHDPRPRPRRDAHGRFAPAPPRPLRGRQAERARSRAEAAALAPWKLAVVEARITMRQTMHQDREAQRQNLNPSPTPKMPPAAHPDGGAPADAAPLSSPDPDGDATRTQNARIENSRTNPMNRPPASCPAGPAHRPDKILMQRGTVAGPTGPTEQPGKTSAKTYIHRDTVPPRASSLPVVSPADHRTRAQSARIEFLRSNPMNRRAASCPAHPADASDKIPVHRGTVAGRTGPTGPGGKTSAKTSIHRGTARPAANPFRNAVLASTVCNTPNAHRLAAKVERVGGWPILIAVDAAKQAGQDWRPAAVAARQRLAQDADRRRPPCIRLAAPIAEVVRQDATPEDP